MCKRSLASNWKLSFFGIYEHKFYTTMLINLSLINIIFIISHKSDPKTLEGV